MTNSTNALTRLLRLKEAQHRGSEAPHAVRHAIAVEIVGNDLTELDSQIRTNAHPSSGYLSPYEATAYFAMELHRAMSSHATNIGRNTPELSKYHPDSATPAMFRAVWVCRQLCDAARIPYGAFVQAGLMYWETLKRGRLPRPTQLCTPEVMQHVAAMWADPWTRLNHPLPTASADPRFDPLNYTGDPVQLTVLDIIDERVSLAAHGGMPVENVLAEVLGINVSETEARRRYGDDVVDRGLAVGATRQAELDELVTRLRGGGASEAGDPAASE